MIRFITADLMVLLSSTCAVVYYISKLRRKKKVQNAQKVKAFFVSGMEGIGPLDGEKREVIAGPVYVYVDDAGQKFLYRHTGNDIYAYAGRLEEVE